MGLTFGSLQKSWTEGGFGADRAHGPFKILQPGLGEHPAEHRAVGFVQR